MNARGTVVVGLFASLTLGLACSKDEDGSTDDGADASASESGGSGNSEAGTTNTTAGTSTSTSASTSTSTTDPTDTASGSESNDSVNPDTSGDTSGPADSGSDSGPSDSTGMQGNPCDPDRGDDACNMCVKSMCCDQITACVNDPDCSCFQECAASMPDGGFEVIMICGDQCMVEDPNNHPTIGPMLSCTTQSCLIQCI